MENCLNDVLDKICIPYLDDVLGRVKISHKYQHESIYLARVAGKWRGSRVNGAGKMARVKWQNYFKVFEKHTRKFVF